MLLSEYWMAASRQALCRGGELVAGHVAVGMAGLLELGTNCVQLRVRHRADVARQPTAPAVQNPLQSLLQFLSDR
jgi:hypothetical protein